jgi:hypothetical protein
MMRGSGIAMRRMRFCLVLAFFGCSSIPGMAPRVVHGGSELSTLVGKRCAIVGKAEWFKGGWARLSVGNSVVVVEGLSCWDPEYLGKEVLVTGVLHFEADQPWCEQFVMKHARWRLEKPRPIEPMKGSKPF